MSQKYFTIITKLGAELLANATALGVPLKLTSMAVGDGNGAIPNPTATQSALVHEVRRAAINSLSIDKNNPNQIIVEQVIPESEGGWFIHEIGLFDDKGNLIAVGNCPPTYKPQLAEGSGRTQVIRMIIVIDNVEAVALKIDPSVVLATREYVDNLIENHEQTTNHPGATTTSKGFVKLSSAINSKSETEAATSLAVKTTYDSIEDIKRNFKKLPDECVIYSPNNKYHYVVRDDGTTGMFTDTGKNFLWSFDGTGTLVAGTVPVARINGLDEAISSKLIYNSEVNSKATDQIATPLAVKKAYDLATTAQNAADTATKDIIWLKHVFQYDETESIVYSPNQKYHALMNNNGTFAVFDSDFKNVRWSFNKNGSLSVGNVPAENIANLSDYVINMFSQAWTESGSCGFVKLPGGIIIQFGRANYVASSGANGTVQSFYTAFPRGCFAIVCSDLESGANRTAAIAISNSQFKCWGRNDLPYVNTALYYIAIGI